MAILRTSRPSVRSGDHRPPLMIDRPWPSCWTRPAALSSRAALVPATPNFDTLCSARPRPSAAQRVYCLTTSLDIASAVNRHFHIDQGAAKWRCTPRTAENEAEICIGADEGSLGPTDGIRNEKWKFSDHKMHRLRAFRRGLRAALNAGSVCTDPFTGPGPASLGIHGVK